MPVAPQSANAPEVFVSYSHLDKDDKEELVKHLNILKNNGVIAHWHDGLLIPGQTWNEEIVKRLNSSSIILLLVSPNSLNSEYINNVELKRAAERHKAKEVVVIPVLLSHVHGWQDVRFGDIRLGDLHVLPDGAKFIEDWDNRNKAFSDVAAGIQKAADALLAQRHSKPATHDETKKTPAPALLPRPPIVGFVARRDKDGRDILELLKTELAPECSRLIALWGVGGVGKTTLAAEAVRALSNTYEQRIVWASAERRADFTFSTFLDEIARQLNHDDALRLAVEPKAAEVQALISSAPTLVVLDNFETISNDEGKRCAEFLGQKSPHPALITTRQRVEGAYNILIDAMSHEEAQEFLGRLVKQSPDTQAFTAPVRELIIETAAANPLVMQWVVAQIDLAQRPSDVLDDLKHGSGDAAQRVFDRSFDLPQLTDDGRAALLALSLFVPSASRLALAEVAGFGSDEKRLNEAVKHLATLRLVGTADGGERLVIQGLTRELAKARLMKDEHVDEFRQRFVAYFLNYAEAHAQTTQEDFEALEAEKDNALGAMDVAFEMEDWNSIMRIRFALEEFLDLHGYWDEAIQSGERTLKAARDSAVEGLISSLAHNLAVIYQRRGDIEEARRLYNESLEIKKKLGNQSGIAITLHNLAAIAQAQGKIEEARRLYNESLEIARKLGDQSGIATTLHQLGRLAQDQGEIEEARRLYDESLEIAKKLGNQSGIAITLHALANVESNQGNLVKAHQLYEESLKITKRLGDKGNLALIFYNMGLLAEKEGDITEAKRLLRDALVTFEKLKSPYAEMTRRNLKRLEKES